MAVAEVLKQPSIRIVEDIPGLLEMAELPGGTFAMGSPDADDQAYSDEKPRHEVTVSGFAISRFPVTRRLYREILGEGSSQWEQDRDDDALPANWVDWFEAVGFCNALSERQGLRPGYRIEGERVDWDRNADGYRLPTEAEWEYAARAGSTTRWFFGDEPAALDRYAWFMENSENRVQPVGGKAPNGWGLHDMAGNVWEWCWDGYGAYAVEAVADPMGAPRGEGRILRGGSAWDVAWYLRSANRLWNPPQGRLDRIGFRVVRAPAARRLTY